MRIYTRTGDSGETGLFGGQRVLKSHPRIAAFGEVDELNAVLGLAAASAEPPDLRAMLETLQGELFVVGADLATPHDEGRPAPGGRPVPRVTESMVAELERRIDAAEEELEPLRQFILPGGCAAAAGLHLARAVCRRAERAVVAAAGKEALNPEVAVYLNRLADLLFVLARLANHRAGRQDVPWTPPGRR